MKVYLFFPVAISLLLYGCAVPTKNFSEYVPKNIISTPAPIIKLSLGSVSLGYIPQNAYEGEMARKALQKALVESNLFDSTAQRSLNIKITNMIADKDLLGFEMTARIVGWYSLTTESGDTVFQTTIHSQGKSAALEAFSGVERSSIAGRRAIAENFKSLLEEVSQFIEKRGASIEVAAATPQAPQALAGKSISSGTGFFINTKGHILTNQHVVDRCKSITARFSDGTLSAAQIVASDEINDLAVIRTLAEVKSVAFFNSASVYRQGDQIVVYGFPLAGALSASGNLTTGTLSALSGLNSDTRYLQISAPVQSGNSGGPLVDDTGNLIGVVTSKLNAIKVFKLTGDFPQNVNFAVKDVVAKSFLQAHNIQFSERNKTPPRSAADIGDILRDFVVYIQCHGD